MIVNELIHPTTGERLYLNRVERQRFKEAAQSMPPDQKLYCLMLYYTGCRRGEALAVTPMDLDFEEYRVRLRTLKQGKGKPPVYRVIELPQDYMMDLQSQYRAKTKKMKPRAGKQPLWTFTVRTANNYVKAAMNKAEVTGSKKATARGLRHSMGVMLAENKTPINVIQQILGHKAVQNTLIYLQVVGQERRDMISQVW